MIIAPSILSADFAVLGEEIENVKECGADWIHVDVMDGHFVPNISIGIPVVTSVRKATDMFLDVHLMITDPVKYVPEFLKAGADLVCMHVESASQQELHDCIATIHSSGKLAGLALKPATEAKVLEPFLDELDLILVMTVEPGFGGQSFMENMMPKLQEVHDMIQDRSIYLEVDGGINDQTAKVALFNGADTIVAGSYIFDAEDRKSRIDRLRGE